MREMILADDDEDARGGARELLPMQQDDFAGIFAAMAGLPVTIRLLDPPLHEFLPDRDELAIELATAETGPERERSSASPRACERCTSRTRCSGTRGCRLGIALPRDLRDAGARDRRGGARGGAKAPSRRGRDHDPARRPRPRSSPHARARRRASRRGAASRAGAELDYLVGTMIELPRAALARRRARRGRRVLLASAPTTSRRRRSASRATTPRSLPRRPTSRTACSSATRSRRSTSTASASSSRLGGRARPRARARHQARHLRRARRRPGVGRVLPPRRARLRLVLAVPRADRAPRRGAGGALGRIARRRARPLAARQSGRGVRAYGGRCRRTREGAWPCRRCASRSH